MKEKEIKQNIIIGLLIVVFFMQLFLKPSVEITDRDWDIKLELDELQETFNESLNPVECNEEELRINLTKKDETIKRLNHEIITNEIL